MPKVSIIVPIFNVEKYLRQCLDSILSQTVHDVEIVLVNDCGTDRSWMIAQEYALLDSRIKLVEHTINQGLSVSRNTGIKNSSAPFIVFVDSDDFVHPDFCRKLIDAIERADSDVAMCNTNIVYEEGTEFVDYNQYWDFKFHSPAIVTTEVVQQTNVCVWNKIFRREIIVSRNIEFPPNLVNEDELFWRLYCLYAKKIAWVEEKLYNYRQHKGSITSEMRKANTRYGLDILKISIKYFKEVKARGLDSYRSYALAFFSEAVFISSRRTAIDNPEFEMVISRFLREENLSVDLFDPETKQLLMSICGTPKNEKRLFYGLILIKEDRQERRFLLGGVLPILTIKYFKYSNKV